MSELKKEKQSNFGWAMIALVGFVCLWLVNTDIFLYKTNEFAKFISYIQRYWNITSDTYKIFVIALTIIIAFALRKNKNEDIEYAAMAVPITGFLILPYILS